MGREMRAARAAMAMLAAAIALAGCAGDRTVEAPPRAAAAPPPRPAPPPAALATPRAGSAVWHLRAGLNVAALSCRGIRGLERDYGRVLTRHRELLKASHDAEQRRSGKRFDSDQTALYNHFGYQRSRDRFCSAAAEIARDASAMDSAQFAPAAPGMLARLEKARG